MGKGCTKGSAASPEAASEGAWIGSGCSYGPASQGAPCSRRTRTREGPTASSASEGTSSEGAKKEVGVVGYCSNESV